MIVNLTAPRDFEVVFETEEELRAEYAQNLANRGLRLPTDEKIAPFTPVALTLRLEGRGMAQVKAAVVAPLPGALALAIEGDPTALLETLIALPPEPDAHEEADTANIWDRIRALTPLEKRMLAPKADRTERGLLLQDRDPQVLSALLRNPRVTVEEVVRVAKSPFITVQIIELMVKTSQWMTSLELRVALIHNPKTPVTFSLRILPTLPDPEVRTISRGAATSMALKTAALKRLQGG